MSLLPGRNGYKPNQKILDMNGLSICNRYLKKITAATVIGKKISYHTNRYTFAVLALAVGCDIYAVDKLIGHTFINSTQVYAGVMMETKIEVIKNK